MLEFWQREVGLPFEETLPLGGGVRQHRHAMNGSVLKLNAARDPVNDAPPSGYRELLIAREGLAEVRSLNDPDGNVVTLVPKGDVPGIAVRMAVVDMAAQAAFWGAAMQFEDAGEHRFRCGDSLLILEEDASAVRTEPMRAPGYRYLTVQVWDVDERTPRHRGARRDGRAAAGDAGVDGADLIRAGPGRELDRSVTAGVADGRASLGSIVRPRTLPRQSGRAGRCRRGRGQRRARRRRRRSPVKTAAVKPSVSVIAMPRIRSSRIAVVSPTSIIRCMRSSAAGSSSPTGPWRTIAQGRRRRSQLLGRR